MGLKTGWHLYTHIFASVLVIPFTSSAAVVPAAQYISLTYIPSGLSCPSLPLSLMSLQLFALFASSTIRSLIPGIRWKHLCI